MNEDLSTLLEHPEVIKISSIVYETKDLNHINSYLANWDLSPVEGEGLFIGSMNSKYGHVKIKMYASSDDRSRIIWNLMEMQLPCESKAKPAIVKVLSFFLTYFEGIKGEAIPLTFEINDGTYHPVDSGAYGYMRATIHALVGCFDHDYIQFRANKVIRR